MEELRRNLDCSCIICQREDSKNNRLVKKQTNDTSNKELLARCTELKKNGDTSVTLLLERLIQAQQADLLVNVRYHSECRKSVMHNKRKLTFQDESTPSKTLKKPGRPSKLQAVI